VPPIARTCVTPTDTVEAAEFGAKINRMIGGVARGHERTTAGRTDMVTVRGSVDRPSPLVATTVKVRGDEGVNIESCEVLALIGNESVPSVLLSTKGRALAAPPGNEKVEDLGKRGEFEMLVKVKIADPGGDEEGIVSDKVFALGTDEPVQSG